MKNLTVIIISLLVIFSACKQNEEQPVKKEKVSLGTKVADSIMYIANVKNANLADAYYMDEWLGGAKVNVLANTIFKAVYDKRLKPYSYITGEEMTIDEVKELEAEFNRKNIGQILFTEDWYFDEEKLQMHKTVNSIMLAYFTFDDDGNVKGNKAGIRVYLNGTKPMKGAIDY